MPYLSLKQHQEHSVTEGHAAHAVPICLATSIVELCRKEQHKTVILSSAMPDLVSSNLLKALALVDNTGAQLVCKAHTERGSRQPFIFSLLQG